MLDEGVADGHLARHVPEGQQDDRGEVERSRRRGEAGDGEGEQERRLDHDDDDQDVHPASQSLHRCPPAQAGEDPRDHGEGHGACHPLGVVGHGLPGVCKGGAEGQALHESETRRSRAQREPQEHAEHGYGHRRQDVGHEGAQGRIQGQADAYDQPVGEQVHAPPHAQGQGDGAAGEPVSQDQEAELDGLAEHAHGAQVVQPRAGLLHQEEARGGHAFAGKEDAPAQRTQVEAQEVEDQRGRQQRQGGAPDLLRDLAPGYAANRQPPQREAQRQSDGQQAYLAQESTLRRSAAPRRPVLRHASLSSKSTPNASRVRPVDDYRGSIANTGGTVATWWRSREGPGVP